MSLLKLREYATVQEAAEILERRGIEKAEGPVSDRRVGWNWSEHKIVSALVVAFVLACATWLAGLDTRVETLEKNEIRDSERQQYVVKMLEDMKNQLDQLARREERRR